MPSYVWAQPSPHFSHNEINAILLNGQYAVTAITALWLWRSTAFRWLQQPIGRYLMSDVVEQVIQRHPEVKNEGIPEPPTRRWMIHPCFVSWRARGSRSFSLMKTRCRWRNRGMPDNSMSFAKTCRRAMISGCSTTMVSAHFICSHSANWERRRRTSPSRICIE